MPMQIKHQVSHSAPLGSIASVRESVKSVIPSGLISPGSVFRKDLGVERTSEKKEKEPLTEAHIC